MFNMVMMNYMKNLKKIRKCLQEYTSDNNFLLLLVHEISQIFLIIYGSQIPVISQLIGSYVTPKRHEFFLSLITE